MSTLALAIYDILRSLVPDPKAEITYQDLVLQLGPMPSPNANLFWRDPRLDSALGELVIACHNHQPHRLPAISSLVVRDDTHQPGEGYYPLAHPLEFQQGGILMAVIAWGHEVHQART